RTRKPWELPSSEVTPEAVYRSRREFLKAAGAGALGVAGAAVLAGCDMPVAEAQEPLANVVKSPYTVDAPLNTFEQFTTFNNFYEFGTDKSDPARNAHLMKVKPWTVRVEGLVAKPADYALEDLVKSQPLEERVYRFRCVEAWSAVVPWI